MLKILEDHLRLTVPVDMFIEFNRAYDLLQAYDWTHVDDAYTDALVSSDGQYGVLSTDGLYNMTLEFLRTICTEHQVTLSEEARLQDYCVVLEFIKQVEYTEFVREAINLISSDEFNDTEKFCELMVLILGGHAVEYMEFVHYVSEAVINKIKEYFQAREATMEVIEEKPESTKEVYIQMETFGRAVAGKDMMSYKFLMENEGAVGMPLQFYWTLHKDYLTMLSDEDLIYELIGFGMMAEGGLDDVIATVMALLNSVYNNIDHLTKLQNLLTTTLVEYRNEISTGVGKASALKSI